ncbi:MAG: hemolysin family protein [Bacteroidia bacterium]|nr:hemolysin family protein [Bacteroidia bacterium]MDW8346694.1 hemolysin family protein [Bacteroidia bacterium]
MNMYSLILISVICVGLFSGLEIAFLTVNRLKMELKIRQGGFFMSLLKGFIKSPVKFISTTLLAVNIGIVMYGLAMTEVLDPWLTRVLPPHLAHSRVFITFIQAIIETLLLLFIAEFLPKVIFKMFPESLLRFFSPLIWLVYYLLYPLIAGVTWFSTFVIQKIFKVEYKETEQVFRRTDLDLYVRETLTTHTRSEGIDASLFKNTLKMNETRVRECMVPRTEIQGVSIHTPIPELIEKFRQVGYSKLLVYRDNVDNVVGYVNLIDIFKQPSDLRQIIQPTIIAPESMFINELYSEMNKQHCAMAVVVDEFGSTYGIVTIEDILEEILGEIDDEHDDTAEIERKVGESIYQLSGRLKVEYLIEKYGLPLEKGEYDTLGGYILAKSGKIPQKDEVLSIDCFTIKILDVAKTKVNLVELQYSSKE